MSRVPWLPLAAVAGLGTVALALFMQPWESFGRWDALACAVTLAALVARDKYQEWRSDDA